MASSQCQEGSWNPQNVVPAAFTPLPGEVGAEGSGGLGQDRPWNGPWRTKDLEDWIPESKFWLKSLREQDSTCSHRWWLLCSLGGPDLGAPEGLRVPGKTSTEPFFPRLSVEGEPGLMGSLSSKHAFEQPLPRPGPSWEPGAWGPLCGTASCSIGGCPLGSARTLDET